MHPVTYNQRVVIRELHSMHMEKLPLKLMQFIYMERMQDLFLKELNSLEKIMEFMYSCQSKSSVKFKLRGESRILG